MISVLFYWDGDLEPFTAIEKGPSVEDLPAVGAVVMVRGIGNSSNLADPESGYEVTHRPAVVLQREFDLMVGSGGAEAVVDGVLAHRIVLAVTNK